MIAAGPVFTGEWHRLGVPIRNSRRIRCRIATGGGTDVARIISGVLSGSGRPLRINDVATIPVGVTA